MLTRGVKLKKIISIIFVIIWMFSLFCFSNQVGENSGSTSKRVSQIIVNIIDIKNKYNQDQKQEIVSKIEPYIRKLAHFSLYALGGVLIMNAVRLFLLRENIQILTSSGIGILYAAIDEIHQLLIPRKKWQNYGCFNRFLRNINRSYGAYAFTKNSKKHKSENTKKGGRIS